MLSNCHKTSSLLAPLPRNTSSPRLVRGRQASPPPNPRVNLSISSPPPYSDLHNRPTKPAQPLPTGNAPTNCLILLLTAKLQQPQTFQSFKMMNLLAISLLISSLAASGFLSSPPDPNPPIREGHRVIVVEYERSSSPPPPPPPPPPVSGDLAVELKDKLHNAASVLSHPTKEEVTSLISKTKHKAAQLEEYGSDAIKTVAEKAKDAGEDVAANISSAAGKAVDLAEAAADELRGNLTAILHRAKDLGRDVAVHFGAGRALRSAAAVLHLLGFGIAFGTSFWVTFASSYVLASALPRQQLGIVQSRVYPVYFRAVCFSVGTAMVAFYLGSGRWGAAEKAQGYNLLAVFGMVMVNMLYLEPWATKTMFDRMKLEKEDGKGRDVADGSAETVVIGPPPMWTPFGLGQATTAAPATASWQEAAAKSRMSSVGKRLKRLNNYSSFLNVLSLMALCWHLVHLAQRLELSC